MSRRDRLVGLQSVVLTVIFLFTASVLEEPIAPAVRPLPQDTPSLLRHLEKTNPEALALARDWEDVAHTLTETQAKIAKYVPFASLRATP